MRKGQHVRPHRRSNRKKTWKAGRGRIVKTLKRHQYVEYVLNGGKHIVVKRDKIDWRYWHVFDLAKTPSGVDKTVFTGLKQTAIAFARTYIKQVYQK